MRMDKSWPWAVFTLIAFPSCVNSTMGYPKVECNTRPAVNEAILCARTVSVDFGPADQFIGYTIVQGQILSIMKKETAKSTFSTEITHKKTFIKDIDDLLQDGKGKLYKILSCEPKDFIANNKYMLLLFDNPRAGIQFDWGE